MYQVHLPYEFHGAISSPLKNYKVKNDQNNAHTTTSGPLQVL